MNGGTAHKISDAWTRAGFGEKAYQQRLAQNNQQQGGQYVRGPREPLTAADHILHLLLTVFTAGLWAPVWITLGLRGKRPWVWVPSRPVPSPGPTVPSGPAAP